MTRRAGVVVPLFSLRRPESAIGEIPDLARFAAWAHGAGLRVIQILPVSEPSGGQNSPYAARTAFALDPVYLALGECPDWHGAEPPAGGARVDWSAVRAFKRDALAEAHRRFERDEGGQGERKRELSRFVDREAHWLDDYALYAVLHDLHEGRSWRDWPAPLRDRDPAALADARVRHQGAIARIRYVQWQLDRQWHAMRDRAHAIDVDLMGDLPFMVADDSADVWARAGEFRLDARVGVPPDAFSADGQDWGLPVFRWDVMRDGGFAWMKARARRAADLFRWYRVDHVVGLYRTFWRPGEKPSVGPGFFTPDLEHDQITLGETVLSILGGSEARVIAEDLGTVPDFVRISLTRLGIPGYRVLRWEKDEAHLFRDPAAWPPLSVATTGTHDTESLADWYDALPEWERDAFLSLPGLEDLRARRPTRFDDGVRDAILGLVYRSGSDLALLPFQDLFGARERINVPGTVGDDNWTYRMPATLDALAADDGNRARLHALAEASRRL